MGMNPRLLRPILSGDPDALRYIAAVQNADQQSLEPAVRKAITDFVVGCKRDGIWSAIRASCILAGARTLSGALVPLKGSAPTNNGPFVSGDYNRKTGLVGNGTSKYLDAGRAANADPQDNFHMAMYVGESFATANASMGAGAASSGSTQIQGGQYRNRNGAGDNMAASGGNILGFAGMSRSAGATFIGRDNATTNTYTRASQAPVTVNLLTHARNSATGVPGLFSAMRISYYSIGESLDLLLLESRVNALISAIGAAIP
jgi:hypothetical protein